MKTIAFLLLALNLHAADNTSDRPKLSQKTVLVRLSYDNEPHKDQFILGNILCALNKNGLSVLLERRILEQQLKWMESGTKYDNEQQILTYLRGALAQPALHWLPPPPPGRSRHISSSDGWGWIDLGDFSNSVALAPTNTTSASRILDFKVNLRESPEYTHTAGPLLGTRIAVDVPDVTLTTFMDQECIRTTRIELKFDSSYSAGGSSGISLDVLMQIQSFLEKNITDDWFIKKVTRDSVNEARTPAIPLLNSTQSNWPKYSSELFGSMEVRVKNSNDFKVLVGLRSNGKGKDFTVAANNTESVRVPNGRYDIYFQYSTNPDELYQGNSFTLSNNGVEIQIVQVVDGNYQINLTS